MARANETQAWKEYQAGIDYQTRLGFTQKWPEIEKFYNYDQWAAITEATKAIPRPVDNIIEYIVRLKTASVLSQSVKLQFLPEETGDDSPQADRISQASDDFTDFAAHTWYDIGQDNLNMLAVVDAAKLGPGVWHYYWDGTHKGGTLNKYQGKLAGEVIDPMCIFFGNPQCVDVQRQPYVLIASREDTELLKSRARLSKDAGGYGLSAKDVEQIVSDDGSDIEKYPGEDANDTGRGKTTVLTRYWRKDGLVHMTRATKAVEIVSGVRMNGNTRYPVEIFTWKPRKRCIYGMGEGEGLIPTQKAINLTKMMTLQSLTLMGFPKMTAYAGAMENDPTNTIGEILTNLLNDPNAIKYLDPPQINSAVFQFTDNLIGQARTLSGATEVMGGDAFRSGMAASAVMAIQAQNKMPIAYIQQTLYRSYSNIGRIWEEFFKNYQNMPRPIVVKDQLGGRKTKLFNGSNYSDITFNLKIEVGPSSQFSEITSQAVLDNMYNRKDIDVDDYIELSPPNVVPFKEEFKRRRAAKVAQTGVLAELLATGEMTPNALVQLANAGAISQAVASQMAQALMETPQPQAPQMPQSTEQPM